MGRVSKIVYFFRKQLVLGFTIALYVLSTYFLFFDTKIIWGLIFSIFFFSFAHYFIIEIKRTEISQLLSIIMIATIFILGLKGLGNIFYIIAIIVYNIAVFFLFWDIYEEIYNRIEISSYKVFTMGVKMFSLLLSLVFAISFLGTYRSFNITCDQIYDNIKKASNYTMKYFKVELPNIENKKIKDVLNLKNNLKINTGNNLMITKPQIIIGGTGDNLTKNGNTNKFDGIQNLKFQDIFSINFWKNIVINQIMENKKILDKGLCETIVQNIKEKYNKPQFQFTVMFFIFLLFYPLIRVVLYILAILNLIAFKFMNIMKLYKFRKVVDDVEIIE